MSDDVPEHEPVSLSPPRLFGTLQPPLNSIFSMSAYEIDRSACMVQACPPQPPPHSHFLLWVLPGWVCSRCVSAAITQWKHGGKEGFAVPNDTSQQCCCASQTGGEEQQDFHCFREELTDSERRCSMRRGWTENKILTAVSDSLTHKIIEKLSQILTQF